MFVINCINIYHAQQQQYVSFTKRTTIESLEYDMYNIHMTMHRGVYPCPKNPLEGTSLPHSLPSPLSFSYTSCRKAAS